MKIVIHGKFQISPFFVFRDFHDRNALAWKSHRCAYTFSEKPILVYICVPISFFFVWVAISNGRLLSLSYPNYSKQTHIFLPSSLPPVFLVSCEFLSPLSGFI